MRGQYCPDRSPLDSLVKICIALTNLEIRNVPLFKENGGADSFTLLLDSEDNEESSSLLDNSPSNPKDVSIEDFVCCGPKTSRRQEVH